MNVTMHSIRRYAIGDAFINAAKGKIGIFGYYFGIVLAFSGMLAEAATETLSGDLLAKAELVAIAISVVGLVYSLWLLNKDIANKMREESVPIIVMIELAIGICGVVSATAKYLSDAGGS